MAKLTNVRERVHQPFRDSLIRTSGYFQGNVQDRVDLFTQAGKSIGETNLPNGSTLPSDQSMVVLALRCFLWFRSPVARSTDILTTSVGVNGDYFITGGANELAAVALMAGSVPGDYHDVHRLYWQASEALIWSFGARARAGHMVHGGRQESSIRRDPGAAARDRPWHDADRHGHKTRP